MKEAAVTGAVLAASRILPALGASPRPSSERLQFRKSDLSTQGEELTPLKDITTYNNFYEFGSDKDDPSNNAHTLRTVPWTVSIEGEVKKERLYDVESILKMHPSLEERVYRLR